MQHSEVSALRIADEAFLVSSTIDRCPKTMMIRELFMNAVEAASQAPSGKQLIEIRSLEIAGTNKLAIFNTGPGMSCDELRSACDIAASLGKEKGLDGNFGMGAKVASLPSNRIGLRYRSCKNSIISELILCERGGVYGRLRRQSPDSDLYEDVFDVTGVAAKEGYDVSFDWTEVVLYGNRPDQDTVKDPYDGDPKVTGQWLADYLYHRFFRLPEGIVVRFLPGTHKLDGSRTFRAIPSRAYPIGTSESVPTPSGVVVHYFYDPPLGVTGHNKSVSGAITSDLSTCGIIYKNEFYDMKKGRQWTLDAPMFGVPFGAKHISVHVELPDHAAVRPEAYRQFLRHRDGDQRQLEAKDFADLARLHRPEWLINTINSFAPTDSGNTEEIRSDLQKLLNSLRVKARRPQLNPEGDIAAIQVPGEVHQFGENPKVNRGGNRPGLALDELLALPPSAKRAITSNGAERAPEITLLREESEIEEKGIKGKAARFYSEGGQLFINTRYSAIESMKELLEQEYAAAPDPDLMRRLVSDATEGAVVLRIGRAVVFSLAKQLNHEWTSEDVARAQSPECLSVAADDYLDSLQNVRRRLALALRVSRQESEEERVA